MLFSPQPIFCPACGLPRETVRWGDKNHTYALCCDDACNAELNWRWVLHALGKRYYANPGGRGKWAPGPAHPIAPEFTGEPSPPAESAPARSPAR